MSLSEKERQSLWHVACWDSLRTSFFALIHPQKNPQVIGMSQFYGIHKILTLMTKEVYEHKRRL